LKTSLGVYKKLKKYKVSKQLGWIVDFFLIVREDKHYCINQLISTQVRDFSHILIESGLLSESIQQFLEDEQQD
jgi:hypothetical protein